MLFEIYCDGASRGQGVIPEVDGLGAVGVVIYQNKQLLGQYSRGVGRASNNVCEFEALLTGLMLCWVHPDIVDPIFYTDSQLVAKTVNGEWFCTNEKLRPLLMSIQEIQEIFAFRVIHVPRAEVHEADRLANKFLDQLQERLADDAEQRKEIKRIKNAARKNKLS